MPRREDAAVAEPEDAKPKDALAAAFEQLQAAQREEDAEKATAIVANALGDLDNDQLRQVASNPAVRALLEKTAAANTKLAPGTKLRDKKGRLYGKVPWTVQSMLEVYGGRDALVEWTPPQNRTIIVNGIDVYVRAGVPVKTPDVFRAVAMDAYQAEITQRQTAEKIMLDKFGAFGEVIDLD